LRAVEALVEAAGAKAVTDATRDAKRANFIFLGGERKGLGRIYEDG